MNLPDEVEVDAVSDEVDAVSDEIRRWSSLSEGECQRLGKQKRLFQQSRQPRSLGPDSDTDG